MSEDASASPLAVPTPAALAPRDGDAELRGAAETALAALEEIDTVEVAGHIEVFEDVERALRARLDA